jgi:DNA-binding transcriptional regulator GbsR (MarR family)
MKAIVQSSPTNSGQLEQEVLQLFGKATQALSLPKSLGEIYGIIYLSPIPLCMEDVVQKLGISLGSASQGLRQLRKLKAVHTVAIPGQRRDYYIAETELRKILHHFLADEVQPGLKAVSQNLDHLNTLIGERSPEEQAFLRPRLQKIAQWNRNGLKLLPLLKQWI